MNVYFTLQDTVDTRNALVDQASKDQVDPAIKQMCEDVAAEVNIQSTAIPVEAQDDGWFGDYEVLAKEVAELPGEFHVADNLAAIKSLQATAAQYSYEGGAWDPQKYFVTYHDIYVIFQDTIATRNTFVYSLTVDHVNPSIEDARTSIATNLHHEATIIPVAAQEDGWQEDFDRLADQVEALA